jgi:hypothetical protein
MRQPSTPVSSRDRVYTGDQTWNTVSVRFLLLAQAGSDTPNLFKGREPGDYFMVVLQTDSMMRQHR